MRHRVFLENLLQHTGHDIDWDALTIFAAHHPEAVSVWISAACQMACAVAQADELQHAIDSIRDLASQADPDWVEVFAPMLAAVADVKAAVNERRDRARAQFAMCCRALADPKASVLWPRATNGRSRTAPRPGHRLRGA